MSLPRPSDSSNTSSLKRKLLLKKQLFSTFFEPLAGELLTWNKCASFSKSSPERNYLKLLSDAPPPPPFQNVLRTLNLFLKSIMLTNSTTLFYVRWHQKLFFSKSARMTLWSFQNNIERVRISPKFLYTFLVFLGQRGKSRKAFKELKYLSSWISILPNEFVRWLLRLANTFLFWNSPKKVVWKPWESGCRLPADLSEIPFKPATSSPEDASHLTSPPPPQKSAASTTGDSFRVDGPQAVVKGLQKENQFEGEQKLI